MGRSKRFRNLEPDCFLYSKYGSPSALVTLTLRLIKFEKKVLQNTISTICTNELWTNSMNYEETQFHNNQF